MILHHTTTRKSLALIQATILHAGRLALACCWPSRVVTIVQPMQNASRVSVRRDMPFFVFAHRCLDLVMDFLIREGRCRGFLLTL